MPLGRDTHVVPRNIVLDGIYGLFATLPVHPLDVLPLNDSPPGRFGPWSNVDSPLRRFATKTFRHLDHSPHTMVDSQPMVLL